MSDAAEKRPVGRPTKYRPEYCQRIIELGKQGYSYAEIAADLEIDKASLYDWAAAHEDFSTALRAAKTYEQAWFEKEARTNLKTKEFNANLWYRSAASRFREDYTERRQTEVSGPDGGAIKTESVVAFDAKDLGAEERDVIKQALLLALNKNDN